MCLHMHLFKEDNYYISWGQHVRKDGKIIGVGYFTFVKQKKGDWKSIIKKRRR